MNSLYFLICSFFYGFLIISVYFYKKRVKTIENRIFSIMIVANMIGIIIDITSVSLATMGYHNLLFFSINKMYMVYLLIWITLFSMYSIIISIPKEKHKSVIRVFTLFISICTLIIIFLPLYSHVGKSAFYTYGPCANFLYGISGFMVFIIIINLVKNIKLVINKKYLPIFVYIVIGSIATFIQLVYPSILVITSMETFVTVLMYFTIENPDMKMIGQLNFLKDQAEKANNAKSDFLSSMSHEIRTPLNAIVGFSQALIEDDAIPEDAKSEVKDIVMASDSLLEIVNGILDISKIEANKLEIINTEYNFHRIIEELISLTKARLGDKALEFRTNLDPSVPAVLYGDHARLKQVILNLLTNSVKYTKEGYFELKVNSVQKDGVCRLFISVEDSGIGIAKEKIDKLFTKFERLGVEKSTTVEGTGLGLAITKKLVELMHGQIVVQSDYGKGSKFTVAIDQRIVAVEDPMKEEIKKVVVDPSQVDVAGKRVLVVDDNQLNLKVASLVLKKYNLDVETVSSGQECIDKIKAGISYDLILLDDMMPKMSGVETLGHLKEIEGFTIPTIALTANAIAGMREKYLGDGFNDYLSKPIDKVELNRVICQYLNQK